MSKKVDVRRIASLPNSVRETPLHLVLMPFRIAGCIVYEDQRYKPLHFARAAFCVSLFTVLTWMQAYGLRPKFWTNIADISLATASVLCNMASNLQIMKALLFHKDFTYLFTYVINDCQRFINATDEAEQTLYKRFIFLTRAMFAAMFVPEAIALVLAITDSLVPFITSSDVFEAESIYEANSIPFLVKMYPMRNFTKNYLIAYVGPCCCFTLGVLLIPSWQVAIGVLLLYPVYVFKLIKLRLENLGNTASEKINEELVHLIKLQIQTRNFVRKIESFLSILVFIDFILFSVLICFLLYGVYESAPRELLTPTRLILLLYFFCLAYMQFIYHCIANEISYQENALSTSFYLSDWYNFPLVAQKTGLMLMIHGSKPMELKALYLSMSLATYLGIWRAAYGYFAMMKNLSDK